MGLPEIAGFFVMAGLDPAIHGDAMEAPVDARNKSGHDDGEVALPKPVTVYNPM
jgi:hypothetical protein